MASTKNQKKEGDVVLTGRERPETRTSGFWIVMGILAVLLVVGIVLLSVRGRVMQGGPAASTPPIERTGPDGHPVAPTHSDLIDDPAPTIPVPNSH